MISRLDDRIVAAVLGIFREVLTHNSGAQWSDGAGSPPAYGFIALREYRKREHPYSTEVPIRQWKITSDDDLELEPDAADFKAEYHTGMFSDRLLGWFEIGPTNDRFEIGWQTGPRFGRGYICQIELRAGGEVRVSEPQATWVS